MFSFLRIAYLETSKARRELNALRALPVYPAFENERVRRKNHRPKNRKKDHAIIKIVTNFLRAINNAWTKITNEKASFCSNTVSSLLKNYKSKLSKPFAFCSTSCSVVLKFDLQKSVRRSLKDSAHIQLKFFEFKNKQ